MLQLGDPGVPGGQAVAQFGHQALKLNDTRYKRSGISRLVLTRLVPVRNLWLRSPLSAHIQNYTVSDLGWWIPLNKYAEIAERNHSIITVSEWGRAIDAPATEYVSTQAKQMAGFIESSNERPAHFPPRSHGVPILGCVA